MKQNDDAERDHACVITSPIFAGKNVREPEIEPFEHGLQLGNREVVLAMFDPMKRCVRQSHSLAEFRVGKVSAATAQEDRYLLVEAWLSHPGTVANNP